MLMTLVSKGSPFIRKIKEIASATVEEATMASLQSRITVQNCLECLQVDSVTSLRLTHYTLAPEVP